MYAVYTPACIRKIEMRLVGYIYIYIYIYIVATAAVGRDALSRDCDKLFRSRDEIARARVCTYTYLPVYVYIGVQVWNYVISSDRISIFDVCMYSYVCGHVAGGGMRDACGFAEEELWFSSCERYRFLNRLVVVRATRVCLSF